MNDKDINNYLSENACLILEIEQKALKSCQLPSDYLYIDGNLEEGFQVKTGLTGQNATDQDRDNFHATFMSMLNSHISELNEN